MNEMFGSRGKTMNIARTFKTCVYVAPTNQGGTLNIWILTI